MRRRRESETSRGDGLSIVFRLIGSVKSLSAERTDQQHLIFLARILKAVTEICPSIRQCLMPTSLLLSLTWSESLMSQPVAPSSEHWDRTCRLLEEESLNLWKRWIDLFVADRLENGLCFSVAVNLSNLMTFLPKWEVITVEEKDEANQSVESKIRVPNHPSVPLQQFLFECCRQLNATAPNTLPKHVTVLLTERLVSRIVETYAQLAASEFVASNQNASLQFYFDLKFVAIMFLGGRKSEELRALTSDFKSHIDPFDFELFHKYVNGNAKAAAQRTQHFFGILIPNSQHLSSILASLPKQALSTMSERDPNILPLCSTGKNQTWFPLLPIVVAPRNKDAQMEPTGPEAGHAADKGRPDKVFWLWKNNFRGMIHGVSIQQPTKRASPNKSTPTASTAQQNLANVKSNAAAFFGAMSQDWFK